MRTTTPRLLELVAPDVQLDQRDARFVRPMQATLWKHAFDSPDWIFERKLDGIRCVVVQRAGTVHLYSRSGNRLDRAFPEVAEDAALLSGDDFVLDGEIVAFDREGHTRFALLQRRLHTTPSSALRLRTPLKPHLFLFDALTVERFDITGLPWVSRQRALAKLFEFRGCVHLLDHVRESGTAAFATACRLGWEGVVAKRAASRYVSRRSRDWRKLPCTNEQEFVVIGFTDARGTRRGFGALLLGYFEHDGSLRYAGKVGSGFSDRFLETFAESLHRDEVGRLAVRGLRETDSGSVHWVVPRHVAQIVFGEWTNDGRLRHPRFVGLRTDKAPPDVVRERARGE